VNSIVKKTHCQPENQVLEDQIIYGPSPDSQEH